MPAASKINPRTEVVVRDVVACRPSWEMGKADVLWEETSKGTMGRAGVRVEASGERSVELTLGRCQAQQGLVATCTDLPTKALTVGGGRV